MKKIHESLSDIYVDGPYPLITNTGYLYDDTEGNRHMHYFFTQDIDMRPALTLSYDEAVNFLRSQPGFDKELFDKLNDKKLREKCVLSVPMREEKK
jgi:hypothetical protein